MKKIQMEVVDNKVVYNKTDRNNYIKNKFSFTMILCAGISESLAK